MTAFFKMMHPITSTKKAEAKLTDALEKKEIHRKKARSLLTIIKDACKNRVTKLQISLIF